MATLQRLREIMFQAQRDAGGQFTVQVFEQVPQGQLWFVDQSGYLLAKVTFPDWTQTELISEAVAETVEFVNRKKRTSISQFWISELNVDDFKAVLEYLEEKDVLPEPEPEQELDDDDTA